MTDTYCGVPIAVLEEGLRLLAGASTAPAMRTALAQAIRYAMKFRDPDDEARLRAAALAMALQAWKDDRNQILLEVAEVFFQFLVKREMAG